jgi:putative MATE family efflux protein
MNETLPQRLPDASARPFVVSHRLVFAIAVPMMIAYVTTPLLGIVDMAVVGQFGDPALLGGLAAGAIIFDVVFATFNFLRSGTTGLVAQAFGAEDEKEQQAVFWRAFVLALGFGLVLILLSPLIVVAGRWFIGGEPRVGEAMAIYVTIRLLAAPAALGNYAVLGYVLGRGEAGLGLLLQVLLNGINIAFSIHLGLVLGWGVAGVAWGTVIGETVALAAGLLIVVRRFARMPAVGWRRLLDSRPIRRMLAVNGDIMIRSFVLLGAFALFTRQGAQQGTIILATNAVLMNFFMIAGYFLDGFATAAEQLAGRAVGARWRPAFERALWLTGLWGFLAAAMLAALVLISGETMVAFMTTAEAVRAIAPTYLVWAALTAITGVLAFQMDGVFIGATWSRDMRNMMLLSLLIYVVALALLPSWLGNHGLWLALHVFLIARGLSLLAMVPLRARQTFGDPGAAPKNVSRLSG